MNWSNTMTSRFQLFILLWAIGIGLQPLAIGQTKKTTEKIDPAADLVVQALKAEADGRNDERGKFLQQAVAGSPDYAPARWHLGQVKIGEVWMSPDNVATASANNPDVLRYFAMRQAVAREAQWIWFPIQTDRPLCHLRKTFDLASKPVRAELKIGTRAAYELWVNGKRMGAGTPGDNFATIQISAALRAGPNTIALQIKPPGQPGVMLWLEGSLKDYSIFTVASDTSWKGSAIETKKWQLSDFNDDSWKSASLFVLPEVLPAAVPIIGAADAAAAELKRLRLIFSISVEMRELLARWCEEQKLETQARFQWSQLLLVDPKHVAAMKSLGLTSVGNELLTQQQIKDRLAKESAMKKAMARWGTILGAARTALAKAKSDDDVAKAREKMEEIVDPEAIPVFRFLLVNNSLQSNARFATACITVLGHMDHPAASIAIVEAVYHHPEPEVAAEAAHVLANRDLMLFVPALMSRFEAPVLFTANINTSSEENKKEITRIVKDKDGKKEKEETEVIRTTEYTHSVQATITKPGPESDLVETKSETLTGKDQRGRDLRKELEIKLVQANFEIEAANFQILRHNRGLGALLAKLTNQELGPHPQPWWAWWKQYNELNYSSSPTVVSWWNQFHHSRQINRLDGPPRECFVRGTPVWTRRGMVPIETILAGDEVLSQDPHTGELAYKLVMNVATRPPTPLTRVVVGRDTISTTQGHRFWVSGKGWRMSKQVTKGEPLHSLSGPLPVIENAIVDPEPTHNLVVEDFHTFFVGRERILVHDAGAPEPTDRVVPGLPRAALGK